MKSLTESIGVPLNYTERGVFHPAYEVLTTDGSLAAKARKTSFFRWNWYFEAGDTILELRDEHAYNVRNGQLTAEICFFASVGSFVKQLLNRRTTVFSIVFSDGKRFCVVHDKPLSGGNYCVVDESETVIAELDAKKRSIIILRGTRDPIILCVIIMAILSTQGLSDF